MTDAFRATSGVTAPSFGATVGLALCLTLLITSQGLFSEYSLLSYFYGGRRFETRRGDDSQLFEVSSASSSQSLTACATTCRLEIAESIPENVTFLDAILPKSTFEAWKQLISLARTDLHIAAYKSSLRGKHVLDDYSPSTAWGEEIFDRLLNAGRKRNVNIRMIENYPPRDRGDNEDGMSLARRGVVDRRPIHFNKIMGYGLMHSKFIIADESHFYLGSANLDWRSLNQKMELGVLVTNCPCLAADLKKIFYSYWRLTEERNSTDGQSTETFDKAAFVTSTTINADNPLTISYGGEPLFVYLAASPQELNGEGRTYDLDAILSVINTADKFIYIHVMDYIPMLVYRQPKKYWSVIDDALRRAVVERGVELKLISAALHFVPENLHFLKSLQSLGGVSKGSVQVKIFKIPVVTEFQNVIARDRRTHNKFMVTESSVVIGTSNWSGDYFSGTTGVQIVATQNGSASRPFVDDMRQIFVRDWLSPYAHSLSTYVNLCLYRNDGGDICEPIRRY